MSSAVALPDSPLCEDEGPATILVVEDESALALVEKKTLEKAGYRVLVEPTVDGALERLAAESISLVLLDYILPGRRGSELVKELGGQLSDLPVVIVTGYSDLRLAVDMMKAGVADYVVKDSHLRFVHQLPKLVGDIIELYALRRHTRELTDRLRESEGRYRQLTEHLRDQALDLQQAKVNAEQADQAKSAFLTNLSHEIRTPLTAILGFTDVLLRDQYIRAAPDERIKDLRTIAGNGRYLLSLLDDILDLSKIEIDHLEIDRQPTCLPDFVAELLSLMQVRTTAKGLQLRLSSTAPVPETIVTDSKRLRQVLINLLGNAIKFTDEGEIGLDFAFVPADMTAQPPTGACLRIRVVDTGIGIPEEHLATIFQPFVQGDATISRRFGGSGLGLSISRRLARLLGGDIHVASREGEGSTFVVEIEPGNPADPTMIDLVSAVRARPDADLALGEELRLSGRILLAEDNPVNQTLVRYLLEDAGLEVEIAENGLEAVQKTLAARKGQPFDVVLMDIQMPQLDGIEATRQLREKGYPGPIVALTAHAMETHRDLCLKAGCDEHLSKPIDRHSLLATLARLLSFA